VKIHIEKRFLLPALLTIMGLLLPGRAPAQSFTNLYSLKGVSDGAGPGSLILSGSTFYGAAGSGGISNAGTVFRVGTNGLNYTTLYTFTNGADGNSPGSLILSGGTLYGAAIRGSSGWGTLFKINTNGTGFTNFYNFTGGSDGSRPSGLIMVSNVLYGTASQGGSAFFGTVFSVNTNGSGFTPLHPFAGQNFSDGSDPGGGLLLVSNTLYGTTVVGGTGNAGTVYAINTDGSGYTNLHNFFVGSDGEGPRGGLVLAGGTLYGTAQGGGGYGDGAMFAVSTNGTGFTNLYSFQGFFFTNAVYVYTGTAPNGGLVLSSNTLYGTTQSGGTGSSGTIFSITTNGTGFLVRHTFTATTGVNSTNSDGAAPTVGLLSVGNLLYGTAGAGGTTGSGTLFNFSLTPVPLVITTTSLSPVWVDSPLNLNLFAIGGQLPYDWTLLSGAWPANVSPLAANGSSTGEPLTIGTYNFTVQVTDAVGAAATQALSLVITNPDTLTLSFTNVAAGMVVSNGFPLFTLAGTAVETGPVSANISIVAVYFSVNNSAWVSGGVPNNTSWLAARLYLAPGSNTVAAYFQDSAGSVSATNTVTLDAVVPTSALVTNVPGTPVTTNWNSGSNPVQIFEGGGIGAQPLALPFFPNSYPITALPGDVVFLLNANGGHNPTNWAAVVNFFNPGDPTGTIGLVATKYQTFFPANPTPNYFAGITLFPNVVYVPIITTVTNVGIIAYYDEPGPDNGIFSGQWGDFELAAAIQPNGFAATIISPIRDAYVTASPLTVTGIATATNGQTIANVKIQLNNGSWVNATTANGWTNWSAMVSPIPGPNTIAAYAVDSSSNVSITNSVIFDYVASAPAPRLAIIHSGANVVLTWPTNATGFMLESTTNLVPPAVWITNSTSPFVVNTNNAVTNAITGTQKFYRLSQ
jgi:uncharacterized repeat protein (TIGR03803 family)